ncbi:hypothetical protein E2562_021368 [Oryza meyeriana var. granulata]|uniref:Uncharacterized protein n=1 Tax=Oryza meyeriana var. granulata TaxID=110450 RepID=A0A6G1CHQ5_9ORYZ|nr:hypothetical protein E2562_021368 [Oryza meyeriana var. granulata]
MKSLLDKALRVEESEKQLHEDCKCKWVAKKAASISSTRPRLVHLHLHDPFSSISTSTASVHCSTSPDGRGSAIQPRCQRMPSGSVLRMSEDVVSDEATSFGWTLYTV